jgi:two-component system CheB/CheR fusion protein
VSPKNRKSSKPPIKKKRALSASSHASQKKDLKANGPSGQTEKGNLGSKRTSQRTEGFPIVGIGASAGGLEACTELLRHLPNDTGAAFVLVQHLDPAHESILPELLSRSTKLPVLAVQDGMRARPNHVYVIPPNVSLTIAEGILRLRPREGTAGSQRPIDRFLESLAKDRGDHSMGVILSGTATDGTLGLHAIKAEGGMTFAQDESAKYESMPRSAIAAGAVDLILSPKGIANEITRIVKDSDGTRVSVSRTNRAKPPSGGSETVFGEILRVLQKGTGVDFSHYKQNTIERRISRRMLLNKQQGLRSYLQYLQDTRGEAEALYQDLLIGVTGFFRDPETFDALKEVIFPELTRHRPNEEVIRVWVYGCSTGEEAYSIAIAYLEYSRGRVSEIPMQIFATDINETAIDSARSGIYSKSMTDVSPERLRRFFKEVDGRYQINKTVRDMYVFAKQNLVVDPPFSHIDLVSCRNVLIYMEPFLQRRIIPSFHYALKPGGLLMLGASESIGGSTDLFEAVDNKHKIYRKKPAATSLLANRHLGPLGGRQVGPRGVGVRSQEASDHETQAQREADRILLSTYSPAGILINKDLEILQYRGSIRDYLEAPAGKATHNLLKTSRPGLLVPVRKAIQRALKSGLGVHTPAIHSVGGVDPFRIQVTPLGGLNAKESYFLILFLPVTESVPPAHGESRSIKSAPRVRGKADHLEEELQATKEYLASIIEQQQAYVEELQSSNEELQSSNEELQSVNEELDTAKEETQATNEELLTLNDEMRSRNKELEQLGDDLSNLFTSVQTPILMVDKAERLRRFTPSAERAFGLKGNDIGRALPDLKLSLTASELSTLLRDSIDKDRAFERDVQTREGRWISLQLQPYRTTNDRIVGAILVFRDVDNDRRKEQQIADARDYAEAIIATVREPLMVLSDELRVKTANRAFYQTFRVSPEETQNRFIYDLGDGQWDIPQLRTLLHEVLSKASPLLDFEVEHDFPSIGKKTMLLNARPLRQNDSQSLLILLAIEDISKAKETQTERAEILERERSARIEVETANLAKDEFLAVLSHELRTPLNAIVGWTKLLHQGALDSENTARAIEVIERNATIQTKMVDDLMELGRIISGKLRLRLQSVNVAAVVEAAIETVKPMAESKTIEVQWASSKTPLPVLADPDRLQQILWNLLSNAVKFTPVGGRIEVRCEHSDKEVAVSVSDSGQGIPSEFLPRIFRRFTQADSSTTRLQGGLGLGLAITKQLVDLHGGSIGAASAGTGQGATFTIRLPHRGEFADRLYDVQQVAPDSLPQGLRILVVEDESDTRELLTLVFEQRGAEVKAVASSSEALSSIESWRPAVLVADIGLPGEDGYRLIRRIRELPSDRGGQIPAVAVTAYVGEPDRGRALDAGYQAHVGKPVDPDRLITVIATILHQEPTSRKPESSEIPE